MYHSPLGGRGGKVKRCLTSVVAGAVLAVTIGLPAKAEGQRVNWAGFYAGVNIGSGWATGTPDTAGAPTLKAKGLVGGAQAGYNWQVGQLVFGPKVEVGFGNIRGTVYDGNYLNYSGRANAFGSVQARVGVAIGRVLPYVQGGLAFARSTASMNCPQAPFGICKFTGPFTASDTKTLTGWTVGGGLEVLLAPNWSAFVEAQYANFGKPTYSFITPLGPAAASSKQELSAVKGGLNFHF